MKYELRGSAGVFWKNERRLVFCRKAVEVVERFVVEEAMELDMHGGGMILKVPEAVVVGENGKIWMQGRILGGLVVAGGSACVELQVKNHSTKKVVIGIFHVSLDFVSDYILFPAEHVSDTFADTDALPSSVVYR